MMKMAVNGDLNNIGGLGMYSNKQSKLQLNPSNKNT